MVRNAEKANPTLPQTLQGSDLNLNNFTFLEFLQEVSFATRNHSFHICPQFLIIWK